MRKILWLSGFLFSNAFAAAAFNPMENAKPFPINSEVKQYIEATAKQYHFKKSELEQYFAHAKFLPSVIDRMDGPFEAKPWDYYRNYFITPDRVRMGVQYWKTHEKALNLIAKKYQVSPQIIVAILGVETHYGSGIGRFPVWDTLATLSFYYPAREKYFRKELTQYLLLTRHENLPLLELKGSYAGALGIPQFMPSSYRHFGTSLDKNKKVDLFQDHDSAMASIANYFYLAGFRTPGPVALPVELSSHFSAHNIISPKAEPSEPLSVLSKQGVKIHSDLPSNARAALVELNKTKSKEYWVVFRNFRAIMCYNHNVNYAMAVYQLSEELKKAHDEQNRHSA